MEQKQLIKTDVSSILTLIFHTLIALIAIYLSIVSLQPIFLILPVLTVYGFLSSKIYHKTFEFAMVFGAFWFMVSRFLLPALFTFFYGIQSDGGLGIPIAITQTSILSYITILVTVSYTIYFLIKHSKEIDFRHQDVLLIFVYFSVIMLNFMSGSVLYNLITNLDIYLESLLYTPLTIINILIYIVFGLIGLALSLILTFGKRYDVILRHILMVILGVLMLYTLVFYAFQLVRMIDLFNVWLTNFYVVINYSISIGFFTLLFINVITISVLIFRSTSNRGEIIHD